ncbi:DNA polymerase delta subunit 3-like [Nicotiana sylvestris]|uniref:DNA polymerase delta subunit 3-like n=1 Tax=Nicotiana sylvestris TaxID=4096 RepID=UPI00388C68B0
MIGSLLYLTASRPDIVFSIGLCASFQANLKESYLTVVKRILRYLKGTTDMCLWYPKGKERGNGKRVFDHSPTTDLSVPTICGVEQENVEESGKKSGGSGSGKAAEGEADLLKKIGASYDPNKRRTPTPKVPSAPKPSKKRKASSPTTTEISLPKGRTTRSRVKQSESDLQKALAESKKKKMAKGKGKVVESSEAVEVEEMEQVHQEEVPTVEVQTPKPKKPKTSSKKSSSMSEVAEPSLAKRTRSAVKSKQVRISKDEEWSGE